MRGLHKFISRSILLAAFLCPLAVWAYPENVRHGYTNCISCHINPNGQGQLNEYGRQLSKAIQSYGKFFFEPGSPAAKLEAKAGAQTEEQEDLEPEFLYGYFPRPKWLSLGGDMRFLQLFSSTPTVNQARFIVMQLDLEAAVTVGKFTVDGTIGRQDPSYFGNLNPSWADYLVARRYYLLFQPTDELFAMAGRFWKPHGILDPNHSSAVKEFLGWNFGTESYNIEAGYLGSNLNVLGYVDLGRTDNDYQTIEKGGGGTLSLGFAHSYKAGLSYFYGYTNAFNRHVFGPWGILGFTDHLYLNTENDFVRNFPTTGGATTGFATYNRLGYEWIQGFHTYLEQGFNQLDFSSDQTKIQIYGVGLLYYPRTHWEFEADFQERKYGVEPTSQGFTQYIYFQAHYYL